MIDTTTVRINVASHDWLQYHFHLFCNTSNSWSWWVQIWKSPIYIKDWFFLSLSGNMIYPVPWDNQEGNGQIYGPRPTAEFYQDPYKFRGISLPLPDNMCPNALCHPTNQFGWREQTCDSFSHANIFDQIRYMELLAINLCQSLFLLGH